MHARVIVGILLVVGLLAGCATPTFKAHIAKRDPSTPHIMRQHSDTIRIKNVQPMDKSFAMFRMNYTSSGEHGAWTLSSIYQGGQWLLVKAIKFVVDGQEFRFESLPDPLREVGKMSTPEGTEQNIFKVSEEFLVKLGQAKEASVWLVGFQENVGRELTARDLYHVSWYVGHIREYRGAPRPGEAAPYPG